MANPTAAKPQPEADVGAQLALERRKIAAARDSLAAGRFLSGEKAVDWLRRWEAGEALPLRDGSPGGSKSPQ